MINVEDDLQWGRSDHINDQLLCPLNFFGVSEVTMNPTASPSWTQPGRFRAIVARLTQLEHDGATLLTGQPARFALIQSLSVVFQEPLFDCQRHQDLTTSTRFPSNPWSYEACATPPLGSYQCPNNIVAPSLVRTNIYIKHFAAFLNCFLDS